MLERRTKTSLSRRESEPSGDWSENRCRAATDDWTQLMVAALSEDVHMISVSPVQHVKIDLSLPLFDWQVSSVHPVSHLETSSRSSLFSPHIQGRTGGKKWPGSYCQTGPLNTRRAAHSVHGALPTQYTARCPFNASHVSTSQWPTWKNTHTLNIILEEITSYMFFIFIAPRRAARSMHRTYWPVSGLLGKIPLHLTLFWMITKKLHHICFFL